MRAVLEYMHKDTRILAIEDVHELKLENFDNKLPLIFGRRRPVNFTTIARSLHACNTRKNPVGGTGEGLRPGIICSHLIQDIQAL
ncbi:hypothetical protein [Enterobacter cloacae]